MIDKFTTLWEIFHIKWEFFHLIPFRFLFVSIPIPIPPTSSIPLDLYCIFLQVHLGSYLPSRSHISSRKKSTDRFWSPKELFHRSYSDRSMELFMLWNLRTFLLQILGTQNEYLERTSEFLKSSQTWSSRSFSNLRILRNDVAFRCSLMISSSSSCCLFMSACWKSSSFLFCSFISFSMSLWASFLAAWMVFLKEMVNGENLQYYKWRKLTLVLLPSFFRPMELKLFSTSAVGSRNLTSLFSETVVALNRVLFW